MIAATYLVLVLAGVGFCARMVAGPTMADRIIAVNGIVVVGMSAIVAHAVDTRNGAFLPVIVVLALYAAAACGWMAMRHWRQLAAAPALHYTVALPATHAQTERLPWAPVLLLTAAVVAAVSLAWFMPRRTLAAWSGMLRSSGGTETAQSSARDGVGSGDKLVGARDVLIMAPLVALLCVSIGTLLGLTAGYLHGWVDDVVSRIMEAILPMLKKVGITVKP